MASLPLAAAKLAKAWKVAQVVKGLKEQAVSDLDVRGLIKEVNEVGGGHHPTDEEVVSCDRHPTESE